jgi:hypothetical protein
MRSIAKRLLEKGMMLGASAAQNQPLLHAVGGCRLRIWVAHGRLQQDPSAQADGDGRAARQRARPAPRIDQDRSDYAMKITQHPP